MEMNKYCDEMFTNKLERIDIFCCEIAGSHDLYIPRLCANVIKCATTVKISR